MKSLQILREELGQLFAKAKALVALAEQEERELSEDEVAEYDRITAEETGEIAVTQAQILRAENHEALMKQFAREKAAVAPPPPGSEETPQKQKIVVPSSIRRPKNSLFKSEEDAYESGQWLMAHVLGIESAGQWCKDHGMEVKQTLTGSGGGNVLVPDILDNTIISLVEEVSAFVSNSFHYPMSSDNATVPRRTDGLTAYFPSETTATTASDVTMDDVTLIARTLSAMTKFSTEIAEDAVLSVADLLTRELGVCLATKIDQCGFLGDGTSTYGGIKGLISTIAAGSQVESITGNVTFATLDAADFLSMVGKLPQYPGIMPKWYISQAGWAASIARLEEAAGGNTIRDIEGGFGRSFLGFPVVIAQSMNSTLTSQADAEGICYFGDLGMGTTFGDRKGIELSTTRDRYWEYRQIGTMATMRFDINVHGAGTASAAGPIIMLILATA